VNRATALIASCLLALGVGACGSSSKGTSSTTRPVTVNDASPPVPEGSTPDADADSDGTGRFDSDDRATLRYGHAPSAADTAQIAALVRRYYAAAAREEGATACELLYSTYAEAVPEDYGTSTPGPPWAQGKTCPDVLDRTFAHFHAEIQQRLPRLKIAHVRTLERQGVALLSFGHGLAPREIRVSREGRRWTVLALVDNRLT
jgi:hypothetical protein